MAATEVSSAELILTLSPRAYDDVSVTLCVELANPLGVPVLVRFPGLEEKVADAIEIVTCPNAPEGNARHAAIAVEKRESRVPMPRHYSGKS